MSTATPAIATTFPVPPRATPEASIEDPCTGIDAATLPEGAAEEPSTEGASGEVAEQLPPADLPTTSEQGYTFRIESTLSVGFEGISTEAPIYRLIPPSPTAEMAQALAEQLGIGGEVDDRGQGVFVVSGNGDLFVTPALIQYISTAEAEGGELPDDEESIAVARDWLRRSCLIPPDLGKGRVVSRTTEIARVVVQFSPVEPDPVLAAYPSITVSVGPAGVILEASSRWASIIREERYQLRPAEEAWRQIERGEGYIEADFGEAFPQGSEISGTAEYSSIGLAYTTAGLPGEEQFLQPVFVFSGRLTPADSEDAFPARAYVPALADSGSPVGLAPVPVRT